MSNFKRRLARQELAKMPLAKFNPFETPSFFEAGGHLIKKKAQELGEKKVGQVSMTAYQEGVQAGVEKSTNFSIKCLENALEDTKGIGDKRKEEITQNFRKHFNNTSEFTTYLRQKNVPVVKSLYVVDEQTERDVNSLNEIREILSTRDLTIEQLLSIIKDNPIVIDNLPHITADGREESYAENSK